MEKGKVEKTIESLVIESRQNITCTYELWERFRPLCSKWARKLGTIDYSEEDLLQESYMILQKAVETYKPEQKTKFETYFKYMLYRWGKDYMYKRREVLMGDSDFDRWTNVIDESADVEAKILVQEEIQVLEMALQALKKEEYTLLLELYTHEKALNHLAKHKRMSYKALTCKKYYILKKLKKFFEENEHPFPIYRV